jgi:hypothetical protein
MILIKAPLIPRCGMLYQPKTFPKEACMKFYTKQHKFFYGADLHANSIYRCILNGEGAIVLQRNIRTDPEVFLKIIAPYREDIVVLVP